MVCGRDLSSLAATARDLLKRTGAIRFGLRNGVALCYEIHDVCNNIENGIRLKVAILGY